jgi:uncharacterized membrane protein YdcZ (DUF606 family)
MIVRGVNTRLAELGEHINVVKILAFFVGSLLAIIVNKKAKE